MASPLLDDVVAWRTTVPTPTGRRLASLVSEPTAGPATGLVVVPPGYERRMHHYGVVTRHLNRAGFATLRFDHGNHVGLSDGDVYDLTMTSMVEDVAAAVDSAPGILPGLPLAVAAPSLSARAAIRALSTAGAGAGVGHVVLLLPVVDVRRTVETVTGADVFGMTERGEITEYLVSEHVISTRMAHDVLDHGYAGLDGTREELAAIPVPVTAVTAEDDDWVALDEVVAAMDHPTEAPRRVVVIEGSSHSIASNPPALRTMLEALVVGVGGDPERASSHMSFHELVETVRVERAWAADEYRSLEARRARQEVH